MTTTADQPAESPQEPLGAPDAAPQDHQPTEAENGAQNGADEPEQPDERDQADEPADRDQRPGSEAARYRRRLRETEAERDALAAERDRLRAAVLEAAVTAGVDVEHDQHPASTRRLRLRNAADLERFGALDGVDVWKDDGALDLDALGHALANLHRDRPELFARPEPVPGIGNTPLTPKRPGGTWEAAFHPRRR